jgi:hypothetical protein
MLNEERCKIKWQFTRRIFEAKKVSGWVNAKCLVLKGPGENYTI